MVITIKFDGKLVFVCTLCACVALMGIFFTFPDLHEWLPDDSSSLASWVQAFGSIAAIFGAFLISRQQFALSEVARVGEIKERALAYSSLIDRIDLFFGNAHQAMTSYGNASFYFMAWEHPRDRFNKEELNFLIKMLDGVGINDYRGKKSIQSLIDLKLAVIEASDIILYRSTLDDNKLHELYFEDPNPDYEDHFENMFKLISKSCIVLRDGDLD